MRRVWRPGRSFAPRVEVGESDEGAFPPVERPGLLRWVEGEGAGDDAGEGGAGFEELDERGGLVGHDVSVRPRSEAWISRI